MNKWKCEYCGSMWNTQDAYKQDVCPFCHNGESMLCKRSNTYMDKVMGAGMLYAKRQMRLPKNMAKGEFSPLVAENFLLLYQELLELEQEINKEPQDRERIAEEAGDVINFASAICYAVQEGLK